MLGSKIFLFAILQDSYLSRHPEQIHDSCLCKHNFIFSVTCSSHLHASEPLAILSHKLLHSLSPVQERTLHLARPQQKLCNKPPKHALPQAESQPLSVTSSDFESVEAIKRWNYEVVDLVSHFRYFRPLVNSLPLIYSGLYLVPSSLDASATGSGGLKGAARALAAEEPGKANQTGKRKSIREALQNFFFSFWGCFKKIEGGR